MGTARARKIAPSAARGELFAEGVDEGLRFREPVDARERAQAAALRGVDQCAHTSTLWLALPDETDPV